MAGSRGRSDAAGCCWAVAVWVLSIAAAGRVRGRGVFCLYRISMGEVAGRMAVRGNRSAVQSIRSNPSATGAMDSD